jgi:hypothetical protein
VAYRVRQSLITLGSVVLVLVVAFIVWANDVVSASPAALAALASNQAVNVTTEPWLTFAPAGLQPETGFIFYPGGKADPRGYAALFQRIAAARYLAVIVPMPLNLAMFGKDRAAAVMEAYPDVTRWVIGGHSLGGVVAVSFAGEHAPDVHGLVLWASYPAGYDDLSGLDMPAVSIYGTADTFTTIAEVEKGKPLLPQRTRYIAISGADHFQFGDFTDAPVSATIARDEQHDAIIAATLDFLTKSGSETGFR